MKAILNFLLLLFFLCIHKTSLCQYQALSFNHLTVNEGLSSSVGNYIYKDSKGYVWIATFDGLNRFDGIECTTYKNIATNPSSVKGTVFYTIFEDRNNNLWIGSNDGLNFYDRKLNQFKHFYNPKNPADNKTYSPFYIDKDENIWVQSANQILYFNTTTNQFTTLYQYPEAGNLIINTAHDFFFEKLTTLFIAIKGTNELYSTNINGGVLNFKKLNLLPPLAKISCLAYDGSSYYIGTNKGLYKYSNNQLSPVQLMANGKPAPNILVLHADKNKKLWVGTQEDGLFFLNTENANSAVQYTNFIYNPYSLSGNQVQYIYTDNNDNLWVSLWGKGIDYVNLEKFRFQHYLNKLETSSKNIDNFMRSIIEVKKNRFWCGTLLNGIIIIDENKKIIKNIAKNLPATVEYIFKDSKETIWISTLAGLYTADAQTETVTKFKGFEKFAEPSQQFNYTIELQDGRILASTEAGLFFITRYKNSYTVTPVKGISATDVYSTTFQAQNNDVYVCKIYKGFGVYNVKGDSLILKKDFVDVLTTKCFTEEPDSIIWIGSTKGLIKFNKKNLSITKVYKTSDGIKNHYIYGSIAFNNDLWLSTNGGISKFNTVTNTFTNFSVSDGLQSNEFNTYSFCKSTSGEFLFGGVNGINTFYPVQIKKDTVVPPIILQALSINDTVSNAMQNPEALRSLNLSYAENTVSFQFAVIDYTNPGACSFLYKLQGYDKDWITATNKSIIRYANLPPGKYVLQAKAVSANGLLQAQALTVEIKVATPWNKSWWFTFLVIAFTAWAVWYIIRSYYKRKLVKQKTILEKQKAVEQERTRISTDMHDDFGASLSRIKFLSEKMKFQKLHDENLNTDLTKISAYSDEMAEKMNEIVWALNQRYDSLADLIAFCRSYASEYLSTHNINLNFTGTDLTDRKIEGEIRRNIFLVIKESLHNIVKHARATEATIIFELNDGLLVTVNDNGKGIDTNNVRPFANGLENMKKRIASVNGTISFQNNNGTTIVISVPI
jgi:signal transduction histidine kinase/ligand-binding sensor domain-containing protein